MAKYIVSILLTALLSFVCGLYLPWWSIAVAAFAVSLLIRQRPLASFLSGFLGVFLLLAPVSFGYKSQEMIYSDIISGSLLIVFSLLSTNPFRLWAPWAACFTGIWLLFAPLVFWAPDSVAYFTAAIIGMLVIGLLEDNLLC